ncbi:MAG: Mrp/NBP35 family ATP-binding protein [Proteobacteria bacterium]|nr:Mrp/NBP35 family ATP-binding protein [Pseudomonadota bacterium]
MTHRTDLAEIGLSDESVTINDRFMGVENSNGTIRIKFASDGMTLDDKIKFEKAVILSIAIHDTWKTWKFSIFFSRSKISTEGSQPTDYKFAKNPYGLKVEKKAIPGVRSVIVVSSGKGGVGKSTLSANLAVALSLQGKRVGLMDCDVYGPSAPTLLGIKGQLSISKDKRLIPLIGHSIKVVSFGFLSDAMTPVIWRGPMVSKAVEQFCYDVDWGDLDFLVVDMPPGTGDVQMTIAEKLPIHSAIIITTPQDIALIDAEKAVSMYQKLEVPILGVVENMAWFQCPNCDHKEHIFGQDAFVDFTSRRKLKVLGRIPLHKEVRLKSDLGIPVALDQSSNLGKIYDDIARSINPN